MVTELDHLHESAVRTHTRYDEPGIHELISVRVVHLIAMTVPLVDDLLAVRLPSPGPGLDDTWVGSEPHRSTQVVDIVLITHQVDDGMLAHRIEL